MKTYLSLLVLLLALAVPALAQESPVPRDSEAELLFDQGVEAFEDGDYTAAYRRFAFLWEHRPVNRKTTAALLMGAKAAYRQGDLDDAEAALVALVDAYPTSGYIGEARRLLRFIEQRREADRAAGEVATLGIALPLSSNAGLAQTLFNGVRLAVESHNDASPETRIRMVFRDTEGTAGGARQAVNALADAGAFAVVGPVFSEEAVAAAQVADRREVVLVPPLATDPEVGRGRRYVFQANPPLEQRGRILARQAAQGLRFRTAGIVAERGDDAAEQIAEGFQDEARRLDDFEVVFYEQLGGPGGWRQLGSILTPDTLAQVEALLMPITGRGAETSIGAALTELDGIAPDDLRVLGNSTWHDLRLLELASRFETVYGTDFYVGEGADAFQQRYQDLAGRAPDRLAYAGHDVTALLLRHLDGEPDADALREALHDAPPYEALGHRYDFREGNVNETLYLFRYRFSNMERLR